MKEIMRAAVFTAGRALAYHVVLPVWLALELIRAKKTSPPL